MFASLEVSLAGSYDASLFPTALPELIDLNSTDPLG